MSQALGYVLAAFLGAMVAAHALILAGLLRRGRFKEALLGLVVPPLAPVWALELGMPRIAWLWAGAFVGYGVALVLAG